MLVLANGMQRSGSTAQYNVLRLLIERTETGAAHGVISPKRASSGDLGTSQLRAWAEDRDIHLAKTHIAYPHLPMMLDEGRTKVAYIYRDLRDAAVSRQVAFGDRGQWLFTALDRTVQHYWTLRELRDQHPDAFLWQTYHQVVQDLSGAVREAAEFLEVSPGEAVLDEITEACSLEASKRQCDHLRQQLNATVKAIRDKDPKQAAEFLRLLGRGADPGVIEVADKQSFMSYNHVSHNEGAIGVWRTRLDEKTLHELQERYGDWFADARADGGVESEA